MCLINSTKCERNDIDSHWQLLFISILNRNRPQCIPIYGYDCEHILLENFMKCFEILFLIKLWFASGMFALKQILFENVLNNKICNEIKIDIERDYKAFRSWIVPETKTIKSVSTESEFPCNFFLHENGFIRENMIFLLEIHRSRSLLSIYHSHFIEFAYFAKLMHP